MLSRWIEPTQIISAQTICPSPAFTKNPCRASDLLLGRQALILIKAHGPDRIAGFPPRSTAGR
jgi:hypothetical protein